ncbi:MAG: bifunctional phosphoribosyl-AMP cyclohydrolase/phosphoribosyl-ATP diphosphatase HisIE [Lachnospiraceae bacterium]|nr:bifunctional phosphoribosyl-AMP cyclohydrolase/phosphoribosyl-ATP diphosphatase HisIE [Lachnospiraceae bacterium]
MKEIIAYVNAENDVPDNVYKLCVEYSNNDADEIFVYNYSSEEEDKEVLCNLIRKVVEAVDTKLIVGLRAKRLEDIKKIIYAGASQVMLKLAILEDMDLIKQASDRFGKDKIIIEVDDIEELTEGDLTDELERLGAYGMMIKHVELSSKLKDAIMDAKQPVYIRDSLRKNDIAELISVDNVCAVVTNYFENKSIINAKKALKDQGLKMNMFEAKITFSELKLNSDGLIPVVVQDYHNDEVLMVAYMNEEAFNTTMQTGRMTYYSRSRQELWIKGETSGHYQYVKKIMIDCDNDTLLAKVKQMGAACHTGNRSCFYTEVISKDYKESNPYNVLNEVFVIIMDRKDNPKEGSYTNYLFDKGLDKILKKCGEEATEIVIAAKNGNKEELKYEISDFMYHLMVLMANEGISWTDIMDELGHRK